MVEARIPVPVTLDIPALHCAQTQCEVAENLMQAMNTIGINGEVQENYSPNAQLRKCFEASFNCLLPQRREGKVLEHFDSWDDYDW